MFTLKFEKDRLKGRMVSEYVACEDFKVKELGESYEIYIKGLCGRTGQTRVVTTLEKVDEQPEISNLFDFCEVYNQYGRFITFFSIPRD